MDILTDICALLAGSIKSQSREINNYFPFKNTTFHLLDFSHNTLVAVATNVYVFVMVVSYFLFLTKLTRAISPAWEMYNTKLYVLLF